MKIPVFVSCPTGLSPAQEGMRKIILQFLDDFDLELRALGRSDYPAEFPMREVLVIARHCAGGLILGFEQFRATAGIRKPGATDARPLKRKEVISFPTPWNHLEAGILFGLGLPIMIFREPQIAGGVFDNGVTDVFVHEIPDAAPSSHQQSELKQIFLKWHARVSARYYHMPSTP